VGKKVLKVTQVVKVVPQLVRFFTFLLKKAD
jgi:hypothetical protein